MNTEADFKQVYCSYWNKLYAFSLKMTGDVHLAQNAVQDVFTSLWSRWDQVVIETMDNYLFRAVKNQIFKQYRDQGRLVLSLEGIREAELTANGLEEENQMAQKLKALIDALPPRRKEIVLMSKQHRMSIKQISEELDLSQQTVKNQVSIAVKQLKKEVAG